MVWLTRRPDLAWHAACEPAKFCIYFHSHAVLYGSVCYHCSNKVFYWPDSKAWPLFFLHFREFREKQWPSLLRSVSSPVPSQAAPNLPVSWCDLAVIQLSIKERFKSQRFTSRLSQATRLGHLVTNVWNDPRSLAGLPRRRSFGVLVHEELKGQSLSIRIA